MSENLHALVIGGSGSLGSEVCKLLAANGCDVAFTYHLQREKAEMLSENLREQNRRAYVFHLDLNDVQEVCEVVHSARDRLGCIDTLIIASGIASGHEAGGRPIVSKFFELTPDGYDKMMSVNVRGVFFACQEAAQCMVP